MNPDQLIQNIAKTIDTYYDKEEIGRYEAHIQMLESKIKELMHLLNETREIIADIQKELK
jgi:hypothetical protein